MAHPLQSLWKQATLLLLVVLISPEAMGASKLIPVPGTPKDDPRLYSMNEASSLNGTEIRYLGSDATIPQKRTLNASLLIDADRSTGVTFYQGGDHRFVIRFPSHPQNHRATITGKNLTGSQISIKIASKPIADDSSQWVPIITEQPMESPVTTLNFPPTDTALALITIRTPDTTQKPVVDDISFFGSRDIRDYKLSRTQKPVAASAPAIIADKRFSASALYNLGAKVSYVSDNANNTANANNISDDNPSTYLEFKDGNEAIVVIDLGKSQSMEKVGLLQSGATGKASLYVTDDLPPALQTREGIPSYPPLAPSASKLPGKPLSPEDIQPLRKALVVETKNEVNMVKTGSPPRTAIKGESVSGRDVVQTGKSSRAALEFEDLSMVRLGSHSAFSFDPNSRLINITEGNALIHIPPGKGGAKIQTPTATAAISGDTLWVTVLPGGETHFTALSRDASGPIRVGLKSNPGESTTLVPGQLISIKPGMNKMPDSQPLDIRSLIDSDETFTGFNRPLPETAKTEIQDAINFTGKIALRNDRLSEDPLEGLDPVAVVDVSNASIIADAHSSEGRYLIIRLHRDDDQDLTPIRIMDVTILVPSSFDDVELVKRTPADDPTSLIAYDARSFASELADEKNSNESSSGFSDKEVNKAEKVLEALAETVTSEASPSSP